MAVRPRYLSSPDPYTLTVYESGVLFPTNNNTNVLTRRYPVYDPTKKNLVLIMAGQSNICNILTNMYTPTNVNVIHNLNICDGAFYSPTNYLVGCSNNGDSRPGNISCILADLLINSGNWDVIYLVPIGISGTLISDWDTGQLSYPGQAGRFGVAMRRLAAAGLVPGMTGLTFALSWWQGESDCGILTSQASYTASFNSWKAKVLSTGFNGRIFVNIETWDVGNISTDIQNAQRAVVDNIVTFPGGNIDTINDTQRAADKTHLLNSGGLTAASLVYNAMHATGTPF